MPPVVAAVLHAGILAAAISPVDGAADSIIGYVLGWGPIGVGLVLFGLGYIVPKPILTAKATEADQWRKAFEDERAAHTATRESLAVANDRAEAAVEAAKVANKLLEVLQHKDPL